LKRILSFLLCLMMLSIYIPSVSADSAWETEYAKIIKRTSVSSDTKFVLADVDFNDIPELIAGNSRSVSLYTYSSDSAIKTDEIQNIPIEYFARMKMAQHTGTHVTDFIGQIEDGGRISTYKIFFGDRKPQVKILATENSDGTGTFQGDGEVSEIVHNSSQQIRSYLLEYLPKPYNICVLTASELYSGTKAEDFLKRYTLFEGLSDDTSDCTAEDREKIKKAVGGGQFASFDMISFLGNQDMFVQFYVNNLDEDNGFILPYDKQYAVVTRSEKGFFVAAEYDSEAKIDTDYISSLVTAEKQASNVYISYEKTKSFRGFDDYVTYFSRVLSESGKNANENGKNAISEYMEYAVNRCSRTMLKAKNNIVSVSSSNVSFIAEFAATSMGRLASVCDANNVVLNRKPRTIPEVICSDLDLSHPVRIEFEPGLSGKLSGATGIRIMLDDNHGIYLTAADLSTLESSFDTFCIEFTHASNAFTVVFTDKSNRTINYIAAPVWFLVPAKSEYSTVMASFSGGTDNWGGQYDANHKRIEFSTNYSGDYQIVENDITINDIENLPADMQNAIRFLVSKGIFSLDKKQNFHPDRVLSRYDFTTALVKMFYSLNVNATTTFTDVPEDSEFYRFVASAEEQGIATGYADNTFRGKNPVLKEQVVTLCGRTLVEKKDYTAPENPEQYLKFDDLQDISQWALPEISVAVQCGLLENSGAFTPSGEVSRAEGARLLYQTFMLLYDVSPVSTEPSLKSETDAPVQSSTDLIASADFEVRIAVCILFTVVLIFVFYLLIKVKKHRQKKQEEKKNTENEV